jgi:hypothetical protein
MSEPGKYVVIHLAWLPDDRDLAFPFGVECTGSNCAVCKRAVPAVYPTTTNQPEQPDHTDS